jgi:hypothetical protein
VGVHLEVGAEQLDAGVGQRLGDQDPDHGVRA